MAGILAFVETREGEVRPAALDVLAAARKIGDALGQEVHALLLGGVGISSQAELVGRHGADRILAGEAESLGSYSPEAFAAVCASAIREHQCTAAFFPGSSLGKDLAPRIAALLGVGYAADCTGLDVEDGRLVATRPRFAGKVFSKESFDSTPAVLSIRPNIFEAQEKGGAATVEQLAIDLRPEDFRSIVKEIRAGAAQKLDVSEASIIVSGGRGLKEPANFKLLEDLAEALGAAVGASRAVVDAGWRPHSEQVGQTGKTVSPQLYFAVGISGAIQHLAGMRTSRYIVAINKDPDAPIFKIADYGIVGDLFEIVPRLTAEIRRMKG